MTAIVGSAALMRLTNLVGSASANALHMYNTRSAFFDVPLRQEDSEEATQRYMAAVSSTNPKALAVQSALADADARLAAAKTNAETADGLGLRLRGGDVMKDAVADEVLTNKLVQFSTPNMKLPDANTFTELNTAVLQLMEAARAKPDTWFVETYGVADAREWFGKAAQTAVKNIEQMMQLAEQVRSADTDAFLIVSMVEVMTRLMQQLLAFMTTIGNVIIVDTFAAAEQKVDDNFVRKTLGLKNNVALTVAAVVGKGNQFRVRVPGRPQMKPKPTVADDDEAERSIRLTVHTDPNFDFLDKQMFDMRAAAAYVITRTKDAAYKSFAAAANANMPCAEKTLLNGVRVLLDLNVYSAKALLNVPALSRAAVEVGGGLVQAGVGMLARAIWNFDLDVQQIRLFGEERTKASYAALGVGFDLLVNVGLTCLRNRSENWATIGKEMAWTTLRVGTRTAIVGGVAWAFGTPLLIAHVAIACLSYTVQAATGRALLSIPMLNAIVNKVSRTTSYVVSGAFRAMSRFVYGDIMGIEKVYATLSTMPTVVRWHRSLDDVCLPVTTEVAKTLGVGLPSMQRCVEEYGISFTRQTSVLTSLIANEMRLAAFLYVLQLHAKEVGVVWKQETIFRMPFKRQVEALSELIFKSDIKTNPCLQLWGVATMVLMYNTIHSGQDFIPLQDAALSAALLLEAQPTDIDKDSDLFAVLSEQCAYKMELMQWLQVCREPSLEKDTWFQMAQQMKETSSIFRTFKGVLARYMSLGTEVTDIPRPQLTKTSMDVLLPAVQLPQAEVFLQALVAEMGTGPRDPRPAFTVASDKLVEIVQAAKVASVKMLHSLDDVVKRVQAQASMIAQGILEGKGNAAFVLGLLHDTLRWVTGFAGLIAGDSWYLSVDPTRDYTAKLAPTAVALLEASVPLVQSGVDNCVKILHVLSSKALLAKRLSRRDEIRAVHDIVTAGMTNLQAGVGGVSMCTLVIRSASHSVRHIAAGALTVSDFYKQPEAVKRAILFLPCQEDIIAAVVRTNKYLADNMKRALSNPAEGPFNIRETDRLLELASDSGPLVGVVSGAKRLWKSKKKAAAALLSKPLLDFVAQTETGGYLLSEAMSPIASTVVSFVNMSAAHNSPVVSAAGGIGFAVATFMDFVRIGMVSEAFTFASDLLAKHVGFMMASLITSVTVTLLQKKQLGVDDVTFEQVIRAQIMSDRPKFYAQGADNPFVGDNSVMLTITAQMKGHPNMVTAIEELN